MESKIRFSLAASALILLMSSCRNDKADMAIICPDGRYVTFCSSGTRVTNDSWDPDDAIGVYMYPTDGSLGNYFDLGNNSRYLTESGDGQFVHTTSDDAIQIMDGDLVDFVGYYPYTESVTDYQIPVDVSDQTDQSVLEVLWCRTTQGYNSEITTPIPMTFGRMLSCIVVAVGEREEADLTGTDILIKNVYTRALFSLDNGKFTPETASLGNVTPVFTLSASGNFRASAIAKLIPASDTEDIEITINVVSTSTSYAWKLPAGTKLNAGKIHTFNLELDPQTGKASLLDISIEDWTPAQMP